METTVEKNRFQTLTRARSRVAEEYNAQNSTKNRRNTSDNGNETVLKQRVNEKSNTNGRNDIVFKLRGNKKVGKQNEILKRVGNKVSNVENGDKTVKKQLTDKENEQLENISKLNIGHGVGGKVSKGQSENYVKDSQRMMSLEIHSSDPKKKLELQNPRRKVLNEIHNILIAHNTKVLLGQSPKGKSPQKDVAQKGVIEPVIIQKSEEQLTPDKFDLDEYYKDNLFLVGNYVKDVHKYMLYLESKQKINRWPLHVSLTTKMRSYAINWMAEVHVKYHFLTETFHMAVLVFDRYIQSMTISDITQDTVELVALTALMIAIKYEESFITPTSDLLMLLDNKFNLHQLLDCERNILKALDYSLGRPPAISFLRRYDFLLQSHKEQHSLAKCAVDLGLFAIELCHLPSSLLALAASLIASAFFTNNKPLIDIGVLWVPALQFNSGYSIADVRPVASTLAKAILEAATPKGNLMTSIAINTKYSKQETFNTVARIKRDSSAALLTCIASF